MLIEDYLWCVASLPAGVFNPYSGVKTCILLMDKALAKRTDEILFVKIESDGFGLGAQRRPIDKNALPDALRIIQAWKLSQQDFKSTVAHTVSRNRILESPNCNLSGDRYLSTSDRVGGKWQRVKLEDICKFMTGGTPTSSNKEYYENGEIPWLVSGDIHKGEIFDCAGRITTVGMKNSNAKFLPKDSVLIALNGQGKTRGTVALLRMPKGTCNQSLVSINPVSREQLLPDFLFYQLGAMYTQIRKLTGDNERSGLSISIIKTIQVTLPPLEEQQRLVMEVDGYRKIIEGAKQVIANYKPTLKVDPSWSKVKLGEISEFKNGVNYSAANKGTGISVIGVSHFKNKVISDERDLDEINPKGLVRSTDLLNDGDILFVRSNGNKALVGRNVVVNTRGQRLTHSAFTIRLRFTSNKAVPLFFGYLFKSAEFRTALTGRGANINNLSQEMLQSLEVPMPPTSLQREIVTGIEAEGAMVDSNRKLIEVFEKKIQDKLVEIWEEEQK
ncbi:MAG TPA: restriction endonuclease subunit S, partial [Pyrinomonadaceae bacterium]|nr:restriction endonuclease subunit S [Pyrinomonadaceae bacterium]